MPTATTPSPPSPGTASQGSPTKATPGSFSRMDFGPSGPLGPLPFEGPRTLGLIHPSVPASISTASPPLTPPTPQPPPLLSLTIISDIAPSSDSIAAELEHPDPTSESLSTVPFSAAPSLTPSPSLTLPVGPVLTPKREPTLTTNLKLPLSSTPSLSISPLPPSAPLGLQPISLSNVSTSHSPSSSVSSFSVTSTPNTSPSTSPIEPLLKSIITSPSQSNLTPYPASPISPAKLATLIGCGAPNKQGVSAGPRPLVLDLRANPDFDPVSIVQSININLPTLLMRRYRKGGAVTAFALESFITMPADKDLFHLIQDGWRQDHDQEGAETTHDVIVLDQDMKAGKEEFGRSPSPAWTLLSVLERGGGNLGGPIRLWYLEGGFEAFQAWDVCEKLLMRPGSTFEMCVTQDGSSQGQQQQQDVEMTQAENQDGTLPMSVSLPSNSSTTLDPKTAQAIDHAVSMTNASLGSQPRQRGAPARRESLFSLNTKSLQRPAGLSRSQTIGVGGLNIKPLSIPPAVPGLQPLQEGTSENGDGSSQPPPPPLTHKGSWLTVPTGGGIPTTPSLSPAMSLNNNSSMDISQSASPDHTAWSAFSGRSISGDGPSGPQQQGPKLNSKKSFSSTITILSLNQSGIHNGILEEDEGEEPSQTSSGNSNSGRRYHSESTYNHFDRHGDNDSAEFQSRMFADGIESYTNNNTLGHHPYHGYDDERGEDGGDDGEQEISCILPNFLYLGPEIATEEQVQELERLGIKTVLNMARECEDALVVNRPGIEYHKIGVQDHIEADVSAGLMQAVDVIVASNGSPIYVHCKAGKSRSVTAIIAYLITQLHWSLNKSYKHVLKQRPCMCPNIGFVTELM
ncbi:hypothetical protein BGZ65_005953, partial [Modicella reniformis]